MNPLLLLSVAATALSTAAIVQSSKSKDENEELIASLNETKKLLDKKTEELASVIDTNEQVVQESRAETQAVTKDLLEKIAALNAAIAALKPAEGTNPPEGSEPEGEEGEGGK